MQTLVFGWLGNPDATLEELSQTAANLGVSISAQGLDARFTCEAAQLLRRVLETAARTLINSGPAAAPLLERFNGVYLRDCTSIALPPSLSGMWQDATQGLAALKLGTTLELRGGALHAVLMPNRAHELGSEEHNNRLPEGALRLADLGYWSLSEFKELDRRGVYWLSSARSDAIVWDSGGKHKLAEWLRGRERVETCVKLGEKKLPVRLLGAKVPRAVARGRREHLRKQAAEKGYELNERQLTLCEWAVYVTNVPERLLSLQEALVLGRLRWQIELLFKLWKSEGKVDESRSSKPHRVLCEVYAKLLAMLLGHWMLLVSCWRYPDRSLTKAMRTVRRYSWAIASGLRSSGRLREAMSDLQTRLSTGCGINKSRKRPRAYQLLGSLA